MHPIAYCRKCLILVAMAPTPEDTNGEEVGRHSSDTFTALLGGRTPATTKEPAPGVVSMEQLSRTMTQQNNNADMTTHHERRSYPLTSLRTGGLQCRNAEILALKTDRSLRRTSASARSVSMPLSDGIPFSIARRFAKAGRTCGDQVFPTHFTTRSAWNPPAMLKDVLSKRFFIAASVFAIPPNIRRPPKKSEFFRQYRARKRASRGPLH